MWENVIRIRFLVSTGLNVPLDESRQDSYGYRPSYSYFFKIQYVSEEPSSPLPERELRSV